MSHDDGEDEREAWSLRGHERRLVELERDRSALFGHRGRPGELAAMTARLDSHEGRIGGLEQLRWKLAGAVILAGSVTGLLVVVISRFLWR